jgi:threonine-phosphate decarboxylase
LFAFERDSQWFYGIKSNISLKRRFKVVKLDVPPKAFHGGKTEWYRSTAGEAYLDFSANLNPFPPRIAWKPDMDRILEYPDDSYVRLKEAIAHITGRSTDEISVGNGSAEIIRSLCHCVIRPGDVARIESPTFGEYALSVELAGGTVVSHGKGAILRFLCNPNNPTGYLYGRTDIMAIIDECEENDQILCVDEAFIDLSDPGQSIIDIESPNLFVLRSLTKSYAVPGLRIGFACGSSELCTCTEVMRAPWSVNVFAEDYAIQALEQHGELERSRHLITREREWLYHQFDHLGIGYHPSATNFILLDIGRPSHEITREMMACGILVRDCASFGLEQSIRVAVRTREENIRLVEAFEKCLH